MTNAEFFAALREEAPEKTHLLNDLEKYCEEQNIVLQQLSVFAVISLIDRIEKYSRDYGTSL